MKNIFTRAAVVASLAAFLTASAFAQTTAPQTQQGGDGDGFGKMGKMRRHGEGPRGGGGRMHGRALRQLNLTDAQRQQLRDIESRYAASTKPLLDEMRQLFEPHRQHNTPLTTEQQARAEQLRTELRANGERMHAEILALLTAEQREQLKQLHEQRKERLEQRKEGFREHRQPTDNR